MSTVSMSKDSGGFAVGSGPLIKPHVWVQIGVLGALFIAMFWSSLYKAYGFQLSLEHGFKGIGYAWTDNDWSHAWVIPAISVYFIYQHKQELLRAVPKTSWLGLGLLVLGICGYWLGIYPIQNDMAKGYSMILALGGLVLMLGGWQVARLLWFPVFYLVFIIRISDGAWKYVANPLQDIAASWAGIILDSCGGFLDINADISGNQITIFHKGKVAHNAPMNVAEACAGLRMLTTFIALGFAVAYLARRPWWARLIMVLSTIPVAVMVNIGRVTVMGFLYPFKKEWTQGDLHVFIGMLMLIPAAGVFLLIGWVLNRLVITEEEAPAPAESGGEA